VVAISGPVARSFAGSSELTLEQLRDAPIHWPRPSVLDASLKAIEGVGPRLAEAAAEAGISSIGDLLLRFPHSHRDRTIVPVSSLEPGKQASIKVEVLADARRPFRKRGLSILTVKVGDETGHIRATWFNQPWLTPKLTAGTRLLLTGSKDKRGFRVSEYEFAESEGEGRGAPPPGWVFRPESRPADRESGRGEKEDAAASEGHPDPPSRRLTPVHPATEQLKAARIRQWVEQAMAWVGNVLEPLPAELQTRRELAGAADAVKAMHFPERPEDVEQARERLAFEELFLYQAILATRKRTHRASRPAPRFGKPGESVARWIESLPFEPTRDQRKAFEEIDADLDSGEPMQRLLMGEVGSGKTVVALYSMLRALEAGYQAVLMAPTETLAEQHAVTLGKLLAEEATPFALLTGATPAARRKEALDRLASGELRCVIGPNGAGKTTFISMISGHLRPTAGTIWYRGEPITQLPVPARARRGIGRKFQTPSVFDNQSVHENAELAVLAAARRPGDVGARIAEVLELVRLEDQAATLARNLSHGQRQWLEIGLLLANEAKLLLLDEPTAGMTAEETAATGELVRQLIAELQVSAIIIEHDINFIRRLRAPITVMHLGRVLVEGPFDEIERNAEVREVYLGVEA